MKISSKCGSQKAPELPLDLTLVITVRCFLSISHAVGAETIDARKSGNASWKHYTIPLGLEFLSRAFLDKFGDVQSCRVYFFTPARGLARR